MRVLHTADWHLADRLKHIDRTTDLERAVERVAHYCEQESVDALLIAGDLFSDLARPEALHGSLAHLSQVFRPFLLRGGTIVAIAGNHDNDIYCETLRRAFQLAAPNSAQCGDTLPSGRFYLVNKPVHFCLQDSSGLAVQFACMPYPTTSRYLHGESATNYASFDERCQLLQQAFVQRLRAIEQQTDTRQPSILLTHVNLVRPRSTPLFRSHLDDDILIDNRVVTSSWDYVALGHLHGPGQVNKLRHVRYAGSIERLSIAEKDQQKGVVLISIEGAPYQLQFQFLPLPATPFYDVCINNPRVELPQLEHRYPDAFTALTRCHVRFKTGEDNLYEILSAISKIFPRCYERTWSETKVRRPGNQNIGLLATAPDSSFRDPSRHDVGADAAPGDLALTDISGSPGDLVIHYLTAQLAGDANKESILKLARKLMEELK